MRNLLFEDVRATILVDSGDTLVVYTKQASQDVKAQIRAE